MLGSLATQAGSIAQLGEIQCHAGFSSVVQQVMLDVRPIQLALRMQAYHFRSQFAAATNDEPDLVSQMLCGLYRMLQVQGARPYVVVLSLWQTDYPCYPCMLVALL